MTPPGTSSVNLNLRFIITHDCAINETPSFMYTSSFRRKSHFCFSLLNSKVNRLDLYLTSVKTNETAAYREINSSRAELTELIAAKRGHMPSAALALRNAGNPNKKTPTANGRSDQLPADTTVADVIDRFGEISPTRRRKRTPGVSRLRSAVAALSGNRRKMENLHGERPHRKGSKRLTRRDDQLLRQLSSSSTHFVLVVPAYSTAAALPSGSSKTSLNNNTARAKTQHEEEEEVVEVEEEEEEEETIRRRRAARKGERSVASSSVIAAT
ncbi:hypothetical protein V9T40_000342 [Parthenolecanium corni]|uniref:Uncharacterized protein n=1 Tax=Parthenolecanium corni TaxID=536013 RepID=A0AAN9T958_9HEMI